MELDELKGQVAQIAEAVKTIQAPNYTELYAKMDEIINTKITDLITPMKGKIETLENKSIEDFQGDQKFNKGKFAGLKLSDVQLAGSVCKAFNMGMSDDLQKAMTSTGSTTGDEWVPTAMQAALWENFNEQTLVTDKFTQLDMPTNPWDCPIKTGDMDVYYNSTENTATTASDLATGKNTFTAGKLMGQVDFSYELTEDSILAVVGIIKESISKALAKASDFVIIHGDATAGLSETGNISYDGTAVGLTYRALIFNGLRHAALIENTDMSTSIGAALSATDILTVGALAGKYFTAPGDFVIIADIYTYFKMLSMTEFLTVDKYGANATIIRGELGRVFGIPVIPSAQFGKTSTTGKLSATAGSNTKGSFIMVHLPSWKIGWRRRILIEADKDITTQTNKLVASARMALKGWGTMASQTHTAYAYNITV